MLQAHGTTGVGAARRDEAAAPPKLSVVAPPAETAPDAAIATEAVPAVAPPTRWRRRYQTLIFTTDAIAAVVAAGIAYSARFGESHPQAVMGPLGFALLLPPVWLLCVGLTRGYEVRFLGAGVIEFERLGRAFLLLMALTTFTAYALDVQLSRGFVLLALPLTLLLGAIGRWSARKVLHSRRRSGRARIPVLAIGTADEIARFSDTLSNNEHTGMFVTAASVIDLGPLDSTEIAALTERGIGVIGDVDCVRDSVTRSGARSVAVVSREVTGEKLRWISWQLERTETDLVLIPDLTEVAGRRLNIQQVGGLPLLYVAEPEFTGLRRVLKSTFDRTAALAALLVFAPVFLVLAAAIRLTSRGPVFFTQTRVGKDGRTFRMVKFRSMCRGADRMVADLQTSNESEGGVLFKIRSDPRVTRVGKVLRRYSLDELPQLFNVIAGSMSLVGPRPPLPAEVATYGGVVHRRLLVKPGLTGLWQISGRSDLSWEESVRLDLRYVESWSLTLDMIVLAKTVGAVVRARGAY
jgi:exopolysaccharide biosynthesis polyprenyl glycosylphosphotransferase